MAKLSILDYGVIALYLIGIVMLGGYFYRQQRDTTDYFLAGRSMGWLSVALSMAATDISAITFMGVPAFAYQRNLTIVFGIFTLPLVAPIIITIFLRFYHVLKVSTAYEYLELRFNPWVRSVASLLFILWREGWLAAAIYAPALAVSQVTGMSLLFCILTMGIGSTIYTALGGMKAVIWTDVVQWGVMVVGVVSIAAALLHGFQGSLSEIWRIAGEGGRTAMLEFSFDPTLETSFWAVIIGSFMLNLTAYGTDQVILQRYLTTKNLSEGKRSIIANALNQVPFVLLLYLVGVGLYAFYRKYPARLDPSIQPDRIIPFFVVTELPSGLSGLIIAAIFAATMSSISSGINSVTTATIVDFYRRHVKPRAPEQHYLNASRYWSVIWGSVATIVALNVNRLGTILQIIWKIQGFFSGVLLAIFLLGMLTRRANWQGAVFGGTIGIATVSFVGHFTNISYFWYAPVGAAITLASGYLSSYFFPQPAAERMRGLVLTRGVWAELDKLVPMRERS